MIADKYDRDNLLDAIRAAGPFWGVFLLFGGFVLVIFFVGLEVVCYVPQLRPTSSKRLPVRFL